MHGLAGFVDRFLDALGVGEHSLVVHDWGVLALIGAQAAPGRVRRLVVINAVPLLPGYRWHWIARFAGGVPVAGEVANATTTRAGLRLLSRQATPRRGGLPAAFIDSVWSCRRPGTWPAMLRLYRSADPDRLAAAGAGLGRLACPALVLWGRERPLHTGPLRPRVRRAPARRRAGPARGGRPLALARPPRGDRPSRRLSRALSGGFGGRRRGTLGPRRAFRRGKDQRAVAQGLGRRGLPVRPLHARLLRLPGRPRDHRHGPRRRDRERRAAGRRRALAGHLLRAGPPARPARRRSVADRRRELRLLELPLRDHDGVPRLALPASATSTSTSSATCSWSRWRSRWSATRSTRRRRRGSSRARGSPTRSRCSRASPRTPRPPSLLVNKYAAVPSMHIAFSLMIAVPAAALSRHAVAARAVVGLPAARLLRHRRDRQPLLARRGGRRGRRLRGGGRRGRPRPPAPGGRGRGRAEGREATA